MWSCRDFFPSVPAWSCQGLPLLKPCSAEPKLKHKPRLQARARAALQEVLTGLRTKLPLPGFPVICSPQPSPHRAFHWPPCSLPLCPVVFVPFCSTFRCRKAGPGLTGPSQRPERPFRVGAQLSRLEPRCASSPGPWGGLFLHILLFSTIPPSPHFFPL